MSGTSVILQWAGVPPNARWVRRAHILRRAMRRTDHAERKRYLAAATSPRLHIGGGWHRLEGWLNTDIDVVPGVVRMDATRPFPLPSGAFAFVFSEHMIEHVSASAGLMMLRESHRVLRKGGVMRITTPDLGKLASLFSPELTDVQGEYMRWFQEAFLNQRATPARILNAHFANWGHQFLYDEETLREAMSLAGFHSFRRCRLTHSEHPELRSLENVGRYPAGLVAFESLCIEATK